MQHFIVTLLLLLLSTACEESSHHAQDQLITAHLHSMDDRTKRPDIEFSETKSKKSDTSTASSKPKTESPKMPTPDLIERMKKEGFKVSSLEEDLRLWGKSNEERKTLLEIKARAQEAAAKNNDATELSKLAYLRILQHDHNKAYEGIKAAITSNGKAVRDFFAREKIKHGLIDQLGSQLDFSRASPETVDLYTIVSSYSLDQAAAIGSFEGTAALLFQVLKGESFP